jgi:DNA polymerase-3 subunit alpha
MHHLQAAMQLGEQNTRAKAAGQVDLFGLAPEPSQPSAVSVFPMEVLAEWSESVRLQGERDTLGLYLTGHPIAEYSEELKAMTSGRIADVVGGKPVGEQRGFSPGRTVVIAGLVLEIRKRGNRTTLILDDRSGRIEVSLFEEMLQQHRDIIAKDRVLVVEGQVRFDEFADEWRVNARKLMDIDQAREREARRLIIRWPARADTAQLVTALADALGGYRPGRCAVTVFYCNDMARAPLHFGEGWMVRPTRELMERLSQLVGRDGLKLVYGPRLDG